jgi:hypothetical protein
MANHGYFTGEISRRGNPEFGAAIRRTASNKKARRSAGPSEFLICASAVAKSGGFFFDD